MKSKKVTIIIIIVLVLLIPFIPYPGMLLDGGTKTYTALTYEVYVYNANSTHVYNEEKKQTEHYKIKGVTIWILGKEVYSSKEKYLAEATTDDGEFIEFDN